MINLIEFGIDLRKNAFADHKVATQQNNESAFNKKRTCLTCLLVDFMCVYYLLIVRSVAFEHIQEHIWSAVLFHHYNDVK